MEHLYIKAVCQDDRRENKISNEGHVYEGITGVEKDREISNIPVKEVNNKGVLNVFVIGHRYKDSSKRKKSQEEANMNRHKT